MTQIYNTVIIKMTQGVFFHSSVHFSNNIQISKKKKKRDNYAIFYSRKYIFLYKLI